MGARPRERRVRLLFGVPPALALIILLPAAANSADPTIEAAGGGPYSWSPSAAQTVPGGAVTFKNPSGSVEHGVTWTSGPETPTCSNVPINDGKTSWTGSCSFTQAGTYGFYCSVHPTEMKGAITVSASGTPPNQPPPTGSPGPGPALTALKLAKRQRGVSVRGSVDISQSGVGARLQVDLFATRAKLFGAGHSGKMRVGRLIRSSLPEGLVPFTVSLKRVARVALRRDERLALQVKVAVTPTTGAAMRLARTVIVHG
jgi:plastocyanin